MSQINEITKMAKIIHSDPRFEGSFDQALEVATELVNGVKPDLNAMRRSP